MMYWWYWETNAKVGRQVGTFVGVIGKNSLHGECNNNGLRLVNLATANDLIIGGTLFQHKIIHKETDIVGRYNNKSN